MTLEIGDIHGHPTATTTATTNLQHFTQIWDTLRPATLLGGLWSSFGSLSGYIPGSSLWSSSSSRSNTPTPAAAAAAAAVGPEGQDASELLDGLLRQGIVAFTRRWAGVAHEARGSGGGGNNGGGGGKLGGRNWVKVERELDEMLERAFGGQPEVVGKLKEAIQIAAEGMGRGEGKRV
jgi:hypothetical protein